MTDDLSTSSLQCHEALSELFLCVLRCINTTLLTMILNRLFLRSKQQMDKVEHHGVKALHSQSDNMVFKTPYSTLCNTPYNKPK